MHKYNYMTYNKIERIILPLVSCLLLCVTSCTSDHDSETVFAELKFELKNVSRSSATNNINFNSKSFMVFGDMKFMDSPSSGSTVIFNGDEVKYNSSKNVWEYSNSQYWFPHHEHSFIAIHPADATGISNTTYSDNTLSFSYTLPDSFVDTPDLLAATHRRMYEDKESSPATPVGLKFFHIMSRVNFLLKCNGVADKITVTKIELEGINRTGTFTITPASLLPDSRQTDDYSSSWTGISNKGTLTANIDVDVADEEVHPLFPDDNALFVIPQLDNKEIIMKITYMYDNDTEHEEQVMTAQEAIGGWEPGKIYSYSITVNIISKEIYMGSVNVNDWYDAEDYNPNIDVPKR